MIYLNVESYCHQCLDFSPDVVAPIRVYDDNKDITWTDTIVQCEYRKRCAGIKRYLEQQMKVEVSG